jgi:hypothetical protein
LADDDVSTCGLCRILVEMAKTLFLSSWRIENRTVVQEFSRDDDRDTRKGPVSCVPKHADANLMYGSVHAARQYDG